MITGTPDSFTVAFSVSVYRFLLAAYPKEFRQEYGEDMLQVFRDCTLRAYSQGRAYGVFRLWAVTLLDFAISVIEEHLQKETKLMNKNTLIRLSGWALVLAGIGFFSIFLGWYLSENYPLMHIDKTFYMDFAYVYGLMISPFLLSIGMLGLRAHYRKNLSSPEDVILLFGAISGPILSLISILGDDSLWMFIVYGPAVSMLCLAVFGIMAIGSKPLPRWNALPILSGFFLPILVAAYLIFEAENYEFYTFAVLIIQDLALVVLGILLQGDAAKEDFEKQETIAASA